MAEDMLENLKEQLKECSDVVYQVLQVHEHTCQLIYIPSIVDMTCLQESIGTPLHNESSTERNWSEFIERLDKFTIQLKAHLAITKNPFAFVIVKLHFFC